ncbi:MAG: phosphate-starvation-inducible PsiE family protein [Desulfuromonadales bacterium]|nr:phosphate-starvation-inducible PsiE family protein [Desulfuromonadales bacterium]
MFKDTIKDVSGICFETLCRALLSLLLIVLLAGMACGIIRAGFDLLAEAEHLFSASANELHTAIKELIINVLMVLAVLELYRTVKAYFVEGRVKVTYIIDTALVVVITDIMGFWHREIEIARVGLAVALVVVLMCVRIMAIRFSPKQRELMDGL